MIRKLHAEDTLQQAASLLKSSQVIIAPCDTIYGFLGAVPDTDQAIRDIKGRGETKPFLQLIRSEWIDELTPTVIDDRLKQLWPGPLTLIVENFQGSTTAFRVPQDDFLLELLSNVGRPLYSTSVNRSGEAPMHSLGDIIDAFADQVELIIDGGDIAGEPSTILDITVTPWKVLRQGACRVPTE